MRCYAPLSIIANYSCIDFNLVKFKCTGGSFTTQFVLKINATNPQSEAGVTCSREVQTVIAPAIIMSPGFPRNYKPLLDCKWRVRLSDSDMDLGKISLIGL